MLKKYLGQAPFDVALDDDIIVSPDRKYTAFLEFKNDTEYEYPLCCKIRMSSCLKVDKTEFDVILPAEGNTRVPLTFSYPDDARFMGGEKLCELEITDSIFDSKSEYEFQVKCEMAFLCLENDSTGETLYSRNGTFFVNKGERVSLQLPVIQDKTVLLHIVSGKIKGYADGQEVLLAEGLCRLCFEMENDGCFEFYSPETGQKVFLDTLNPEYFI